ncbi:hypothetical protein TWF730_008145 [Orbilia blumenaviensis]|uniref:Uncharacterized protein n=1 Tax=Orbilia blumenaviensis TaxID=1796055 RepID=A0AAV9V830_9PEZI
MGESRQELINWLNALLQLNLTKVEQCGTGAAFCQIMDSVHGNIPMSRVKFNVNTEYAYLQNFKILTNAFSSQGIDRPVPVQSLVKCKMQDNLEFLQWMKRYWDANFPGGEYDAVARRKGQGMTSAPAAAPRSTAAPKARGTTPQVTAQRTRTPLGGASTTALQAEISTLKESVAGLERERDFYFSKLRDIELLLQESQEDPAEEKAVIIKKVQDILYSTEDGFEIPEEEQVGNDDETF